MNFIVKKELKEYKKFKEKYIFVQKEVIQDGENMLCDGEIVKQGEDIIGFSDKWINVGYKLKGPYSKVLSNLFPYEFKFRGKKLNSIESFFQGIKFKDKNLQNYVLKYSGLASNNIKVATLYDWKEKGILYWQGRPIKRESKEYEDLIDELYISALQNPLYRNVLQNCDRDVIHIIGSEDKKETVFTRYEFEHQINCLINFFKRG